MARRKTCDEDDVDVCIVLLQNIVDEEVNKPLFFISPETFNAKIYTSLYHSTDLTICVL